MIPEIDPLDMGAGSVKTGFPLLQHAGPCELIIKDATVAPGKKDPNKQVITLLLNTNKEYMSTDNETLHPGFPLRDYVVIDTSTPEGKARTVKSIAAICKATGQKDLTPRQVIDKPSVLVGRILMAKVGIAKETDGFPESNKIKQYVPLD